MAYKLDTNEDPTEEGESKFFFLSHLRILFQCHFPEILVYAKYLGMDPDYDREFFYIAVEGLKCPLPEDWVAWYDLGTFLILYNLAFREKKGGGRKNLYI